MNQDYHFKKSNNMKSVQIKTESDLQLSVTMSRVTVQDKAGTLQPLNEVALTIHGYDPGTDQDVEAVVCISQNEALRLCRILIGMCTMGKEKIFVRDFPIVVTIGDLCINSQLAFEIKDAINQGKYEEAIELAEIIAVKNHAEIDKQIDIKEAINSNKRRQQTMN